MNTTNSAEAQPQGGELIPCPFCDGPGSMTTSRSAAIDARTIYNPACNACSYVFDVGFFHIEDAIKAWNTRVHSPHAAFLDECARQTACEIVHEHVPLTVQLPGGINGLESAIAGAISRYAAPRADLPRATAADGERERIIAMADALEYELPNLEQMKGVAALRKKLQAESPRATGETTVEVVLGELSLTDSAITKAAETIRIWFYRNDFDSQKCALDLLQEFIKNLSAQTEFFWVIERFEGGRSAGYWNGCSSRSFVSDVDAAIQFRRKEDAIPIHSSWHWKDTQITQHGCMAQVRATRTEGEGEDDRK